MKRAKISLSLEALMHVLQKPDSVELLYARLNDDTGCLDIYITGENCPEVAEGEITPRMEITYARSKIDFGPNMAPGIQFSAVWRDPKTFKLL